MMLTSLKTRDQDLRAPSPKTEDIIAPQGKAACSHSHLQFHFDYQGVLLPSHQALEVITVPISNITPVPNLSPVVLGLINHRSQVLWVIDLALLIGLPTAYADSQECSLVILQANGTLLALWVQEIDGILDISPQQIEAAPDYFPPRLMPFLQGCFWHNDALQIVLNAEAVLQAPELQAG